MKKIFLVVLILFTHWVPVSAESYIVIGADDHEVIMAKDEHEIESIASITKIMTAYLALEYGDFTDTWLVGEEVLQADGSRIYVELGQQVSMRSLLYGLMLKSGNDAALIIAKRVSGSVEKFVALMNKKAKEIGMINTEFHNPHGLDVNMEGNYSTPYDMALLMQEALKNEMFCEIIKTMDYTSEWGAKWHNSNKLLESFPFCIGGKTGYTSKAGRTLVTAAKKDGATYIIVTFNLQDNVEFHHETYLQVMNERTVVTLLEPQVIEIDNYTIVIDHPFTVVATEDEIEAGEMSVYLNKSKKEYIVQWSYMEHQKVEVYKATKKFCLWRWCF